MYKCILLILYLSLPSSFASNPTHADDATIEKINIIVGGYLHEPFVDAEGRGLTIDLIKALNGVQSLYNFSFKFLPPKRRYEQFRAGNVDMMFFEAPVWSWKRLKIPHTATRVFIRVSEYLVALKSHPLKREVFNNLEKRRLAGIHGYHYAFADFRRDPASIKERFNIVLTNSHEQVLELLLRNRAEVGVLSDMYLDFRYRHSPDLKADLLLSEKADQQYALPMIVTPNSPLQADKLETIIDKIIRSGQMGEIVPTTYILP